MSERVRPPGWIQDPVLLAENEKLREENKRFRKKLRYLNRKLRKQLHYLNEELDALIRAAGLGKDD